MRFPFRLLKVAIWTILFGFDLTNLRAEPVPEDADIVFAVDISRSMLAKDIKVGDQSVSRIDAVRRAISKCVSSHNKWRIGLVTFCAEPYVVKALTNDRQSLVQDIDLIRCEYGSDGTAIGSALIAAIKQFEPGENRRRGIVLISDGDNNAGFISPVTAATIATKLGINLLVLAVGTKSVAPMPMKSGDDKIQTNVLVSVDPEALKKIAGARGTFHYLDASAFDLQLPFVEQASAGWIPQSLTKIDESNWLAQINPPGAAKVTVPAKPDEAYVTLIPKVREVIGRVQRAPAIFERLLPGKYELTVRCSGYKTETREVTIGNGQTIYPERLTLSPLNKSEEVTSNNLSGSKQRQSQSTAPHKMSASASFTSETMAMGDTVDLLITLKTKAAAKPLAASDLVGRNSPFQSMSAPEVLQVDGLSITYYSSSTRMSITTEAGAEESVEYRYRVTPRRAGTFTVPPVNITVAGEQLATEPVRLNVGASRPGQPREFGFATMKLGKETARIGEEIPVEVQLALDASLSCEVESLPDFLPEGVVCDQLHQESGATEMKKEGVSYKVFTFKSKIIPIRNGRLKLNPLTFQLLMRKLTKAGQKDDPVAGAFGDFFGERERKSLETNEAALEVK